MTIVPLELTKWVKRQAQIPVTIFSSKQAFNERAHFIFKSIQDKIKENGSQRSFYDIYDKRKFAKREPEIRDLILMLISDQALNSNIDINPEVKTGVGNLDITLSGLVKNIGSYSIGVECKKDYSTDELIKGYAKQLPAYMLSLKLEYGIFLVFRFELEEEPEFVIRDYALDNASEVHPLTENIKIVSVDLRLKPTASNL